MCDKLLTFILRSSAKMNANLKYLATSLWAAACVISLSGCAKALNNWPGTLNFSPSSPPRAAYHSPAPVRHSEETEPQTRSSSARPARSVHRSVRTSAQEPASAHQPSLPPPAPTPAPTVTLAGEDSDSVVTRRSLEATTNRIASIRRAGLNSTDAATYDQVNGFLKAGREALERRDYVAASGFAQKASALANRLPSEPSH